ncbi:hypothetical protein [Halomicrobium urmianum]|uniref:hypothetical protein n=1 Tax=Halomicrobium urmianum TaxID=1586233 RepID=UPI001CD9CD6A|nr:hypothetical protein [Halomicrobium urmianum]
MSSPPTNQLRTALNEATPIEHVSQSIVRRTRSVAFWTAVTLPFLYLPLLATGLEKSSHVTAFLALLAANAVALLVGHSHLRE